MLLIFLYILSAFLTIFIDFEPLKTAGVLLSVCYLPGLCLFAFVKKKNLELEELILAFPVSIGISSILILGLLYLDVPAGYITNIINVIAGAAVLTYIITKHKNKSYTAIKLTRQELTFCFLAFLATLLLAIPVLLGSEGAFISTHSFFHSSITTQIINGIFPPESPGLGGTMIAYPWAFHALIAALSAPTNYNLLKIISTINLLSLFWILCIAYSVAKFFGFSEKYRYLVPLATIGLLCNDAGILFTIKFFSGTIPLVQNLLVWIQNMGFVQVLFLEKFYFITAMPLGLCLIFAYILILLLLSKRTPPDRNRKVYLISLGALVIANILAYLPLAIIPLLHIPFWAGFIFLAAQGTFKERLKESVEIMLPYMIAILLALPYLFYIRDALQATTSGLASGELIGLTATVTYVTAFWFSFPVIAVGIWIAFKRFPSKALYFLLTGTFLILGFLIFVKWGGRNIYKFTYVLSFFVSIFFVLALSVWLPIIHNRRLKGMVAAGIVLFLLYKPVSAVKTYIIHPRFRDTTYSVSGKHIAFAKDSVKNEAYKWIRDNTPREALLMLANPDMDLCNSADNKAYELSALSERSLFVVSDMIFTEKLPEYKERLRISEELFKDALNPQVRSYFASLKRPVYLLIEDDHNESLENLQNNFPLMFNNNSQRVYLVHDTL